MVHAMTLIQLYYPGLIYEFKKSYCASLVLHHQQRAIQHMLHEGIITDLDANPIIERVSHQLKYLYLEPAYNRLRSMSRKIPHKYLDDPMNKISRNLSDKFHSVRNFIGLHEPMRATLRNDQATRRKLIAVPAAVRMAQAISRTNLLAASAQVLPPAAGGGDGKEGFTSQAHEEAAAPPGAIKDENAVEALVPEPLSPGGDGRVEVDGHHLGLHSRLDPAGGDSRATGTANGGA